MLALSLSLSPSRVSPSSLSLSHNDGADHPSPPILPHRRSYLTVDPPPLPPLLPPPLSLSQTTLTVARPSPPLLPHRRSSLTADFKGNVAIVQHLFHLNLQNMLSAEV
ncbi:unnamed protein product [Camellia sinensis]